MPEPTRRFVSATLVGLVATTTDVVLLTLLYRAGIVVAIAAFAGTVAGAAVAFVANKHWSFRDRQPVSLRQLATYAAVCVGTGLFTAAAMHVAVDREHVPYLLAKVVSAAVVFACWTYPAQRRLVFA
ncbi:MAG TPA: GtrA family protein [Kofleriaceae bacterium]|nr:GtrA family protein [Kofleriaceae bacterium]